MATYAVNGDTLTGIADAIRAKTGSDDQMTVAAMAAAIESITAVGTSDILVDSGAFTPETITRCMSRPISHRLGAVPKLVIVYIDSPEVDTSLTEACLVFGIYANTGGAFYGSNDCLYSLAYTQANGSLSKPTVSQSNIDAYFKPYLTSDSFIAPVYNTITRLYTIRYKWLAATWQ